MNFGKQFNNLTLNELKSFQISVFDSAVLCHLIQRTLQKFKLFYTPTGKTDVKMGLLLSSHMVLFVHINILHASWTWSSDELICVVTVSKAALTKKHRIAPKTLSRSLGASEVLGLSVYV